MTHLLYLCLCPAFVPHLICSNDSTDEISVFKDSVPNDERSKATSQDKCEEKGCNWLVNGEPTTSSTTSCPTTP